MFSTHIFIRIYYTHYYYENQTVIFKEPLQYIFENKTVKTIQ
jgi:hypothetical protein